MPRRKHAILIKDDRAALTPGSSWWAYLRVSLGEKQDIASQRRAVQEFADRHAVTIARWWIDDHVSGSSVNDREAFEQMIGAARHNGNAAAGVLVWNLARWARNDLESQYYRAELRLLGYAVVSVSDEVPGGDASLIYEAFLDWKNRRFLQDLSADTKRGLRDTVLREVEVDGKMITGWSGGGFPPRGYRARYVETGKRRDGKPRVNAVWEIDPVWHDRVAKARRMFADGEPVKKIHDECGLFKNLSAYPPFWACPTYRGARKCGDLLIQDAHPAYDDAEQQAKIEARIAAMAERFRRTHPRTKIVHMLSGIAHCGHCGSVLHGHAHRFGDHYYCARSQRRDSPCKAKRILCDTLDRAVVKVLQTRILTEEAQRELVDMINAERAKGGRAFAQERQRIEREQRRLAKTVQGWLDAMDEAGETPRAVIARVAALEKQQAANEARLRAIDAEEAAARPLEVTDEQLRQVVNELQAKLAGNQREDVWMIVRTYVQRVDVWDDHAEVLPTAAIQGRIYRISEYPQPDSNRRSSP